MTAPTVDAFFDKATFTVTYVVADPEAKVCAVIDPVLDFDAAAGRTSHRSADAVIAPDVSIGPFVVVGAGMGGLVAALQSITCQALETSGFPKEAIAGAGFGVGANRTSQSKHRNNSKRYFSHHVLL